MGLFKKIVKEIVEFKYTRIKKPAKDEILFFQLPTWASQDEVERFKARISHSMKQEGPIIVFSGEVKVIKSKKKDVKVR